MTELEQQAFDHAMRVYGFPVAELTPERERRVRHSLVYAHRLLKLRMSTAVAPFIEAFRRAAERMANKS